MGCDNELLALFRDGPNDRVAAAVLGFRVLQMQEHLTPINPRISNLNGTQQTERNIMIDREVTTNDRERERMRRRYGRNVEVRYLDTILGLRDKLRSLACNQHYCPMIKERLEQHQRDIHSSARCPGHRHKPQRNVRKSGPITSTPRSRKCVSVRTGPDEVNQFSTETECPDYQLPQATSFININPANYVDRQTMIEKSDDGSDHLYSNHSVRNYDTCCTQSEKHNTPKKIKIGNVDNFTSIQGAKSKRIRCENICNNPSNANTTTKRIKIDNSVNKRILKQPNDVNTTCSMDKCCNSSRLENTTPNKSRSFGINNSCSFSNDRTSLCTGNKIELLKPRHTNKHYFHNDGTGLPREVPTCPDVADKITKYFDRQISEINKSDSRTTHDNKIPFAIGKSCCSTIDNNISLSPIEKQEMLDTFNQNTPTSNRSRIESLNSFKRKRSYDLNKPCCSEPGENISQAPDERNYIKRNSSRWNDSRDIQNHANDRRCYVNKTDDIKKMCCDKLKDSKVSLNPNEKEEIKGLRNNKSKDFAKKKGKKWNQRPLNPFPKKSSERFAENIQQTRNNSSDDCRTLSKKEKTFDDGKSCCSKSEDSKLVKPLPNREGKMSNQFDKNVTNPTNCMCPADSNTLSDKEKNNKDISHRKSKKWKYPGFIKGFRENKEYGQIGGNQTDNRSSIDCKTLSNKENTYDIDKSCCSKFKDNDSLIFIEKSEKIDQKQNCVEKTNNRNDASCYTIIDENKSPSFSDINETLNRFEQNINKQTNYKRLNDSQIFSNRKRSRNTDEPCCSTFDNSRSLSLNKSDDAAGITPSRNGIQDNTLSYNRKRDRETTMCNDFKKEPKRSKKSDSDRSDDKACFQKTSKFSRTPSVCFDESNSNIFCHSIQLRHNDSKLMWNNRKNCNINSIRKEVEEWIQELPMYPGLGKEAKNDIENETNVLIRNLNNFPLKTCNLEFEQNARDEINTCLNKLPIWYSGYTRDQRHYTDCLIDRLLQKIKYPHERETAKLNVSMNSTGKYCKHTETCYSNALIKEEIKKAITAWLWTIYLKTKSCKGMVNTMPRIADFIYIRITPLLYKPSSKNNRKPLLKSAILDVLKNMPRNTNCSGNRDSRMLNLADDLVNKLITIQENCSDCCENKNVAEASTSSYNNCHGGINCETKQEENYNTCDVKESYENACTENKIYKTASTSHNQFCRPANFRKNQEENLINCEVRKCFENASIDCSNEVIKEAGIIMIDFSKMPDPESENDAINEIINLLVTSTNLSEAQACNITNIVIKKIKNVIQERQQYFNYSLMDSRSRQSNNLSIFTSIEQMKYPITSTPQKKPVKKEIPKLNPEEIQYMDNVANLLRAWMDTLPENFSGPDEQNFKETMIYDLAGDIMDEVKLEQLAPDANKDRRKHFKYLVYRWAFKLRVYDLQEIQPQIENFLDKLENIPVPIMTQPQHGNRQVMENIKHNVVKGWEEVFLPKAGDILEDEISIWMNEQPSNLFTNNNKVLRNEKVHELAQVLQIKLAKKHLQTEILQDVTQWLAKIVKPEEKREIGELAENLKDRIIGLPQDATLCEKFNQAKAKHKEKIKKHLKGNESLQKNIYQAAQNEIIDQENTMKVFISKYIEHNYDIDDPLARQAFNRLLKTYLQILSPPTRKEVYDNFAKRVIDNRFLPEILIKELEYIKDISDWLKNLPVNGSYNSVGNRERIDFVNSLAISIREVEEKRNKDPDAMDYNLHMATTIFDFLQMLPIPKEHLNNENINFMIGQLISKITIHRQAVINKTTTNDSLNTTGVNSENIGDFIEEFIRINGDDIAEDEVKLEAWATRLIKEIINIIRDTSHPNLLTKGYIYNKLTNVSLPGDESANLFSLELDYVREISNWMKNLPLLPLKNKLEENDRVKKICELAETIVEMEAKNRSGIALENCFKEHLAKWISELSLQENKIIDLPIVIQQLTNRLERVKNKDETNSKQNDLITENTFCQHKKKRKSTITSRNKCKDPNNVMVDVIEQWSNALPVNTEDENTTTNMKHDISRKLSQKVGQLNLDPRVFNDDVLYTDILVDEIDNVLDNLPQSTELQQNREDLKLNIVNAVVDIKNDIKERTAGDMYKLKLENTIEASIPNPVKCNKMYDPGFEIYKERLATAFILENFDHGADAVKVKYEKLLKKEIDKYFEHAIRKSAEHLSNDELYNVLYSALFKVPIPNEVSIINEVREIKTRCVIDTWFEELPIKEAEGVTELLKWDNILATLAKRIHEIETLESKPDQKILKEIMKWIVKLPLKPGHEHECDKFAKKLQEMLKHTVNQRKCVLDNSKTCKRKKCKEKAKAKKSTKSSKEEIAKEDSNYAGPSNIGDVWTSLPVPEPKHREPKMKAADLIFEIVQNWCYQLPIHANTLKEKESAQILKDSLMTKILIKICDLNMDPLIFNDNIYYDELLDKQLDILLSATPLDSDFYKSKTYKKTELKEALKSIKPLMMEERANFKYKQDLNKTVDNILEKPETMPPEKEALFSELRNDIVDDFIQYKYDKNNDEATQIHKTNIENSIFKYNNNVINDKDTKNTLIKTNQLISELSKIPATCKINLRDDVDEIRMKREVADFFDELALSHKIIDKIKINYMKTNLAKKLNDIEMNGHSPENESRMNQEVVRCLNKFGKKINPAVIDTFTTKLRNNEKTRRAPQHARAENENNLHICHEDCRRICHTGKQKSETDSAHLLDLPNCISLANANKLQYLDTQRTDARRGIACGLSSGANQFQAQHIKDQMTNAQRLPNGGASTGEDDSKTSSGDDAEDERLCYCRTELRRMQRPYCMVPLQYIYGGYSPFWCRMLLPGFY